ncbi:DUF885 domain-containing protein [Kribbella sandramycini]|uniref:DUF885 domain-containing protein n=1 Tax=Kribbella sandramycini TaxID=60450 RepID=A0A7Y4KZ00_9ACTN|nr:DUF885 domain-containing protein [Kribbella sandramycini]MBB6569752.1 uncharacterized protein (DUF885 family) [Kribbella sandramycini]NOL40421.1 DUF885 domain-containing protein [Kribbella sandramycini]
MTPSSPIDELSERFLEAHAELSPATATIMGMQGYDDRLPDRSPDGFAALIDLHRRTIAEAKAVEVSSFREETAKDALLERIELTAERLDAGVPQYELNGISCVPVELRLVFDLMPTATDDDWENVGSRLGQVGATLDGYRETLLQQAAAGRISAARQIQVLADRIAEWTGADGNDYFRGLTANAPDSPVKTRVDAAAIEASKAFGQFGQWLTTDLLPQAPDRDAVGREVYQLASRDHIGATLDLEEAYAWGWQELARIEGEMQTIAAALNDGDRSIPALAAVLDADPARKIHGKEAFRDWMQELADGAVRELGGKHFDIPDEIARIECKIAATSEGVIYYTPPSEDLTTRPGQMWWAVPAGIEDFATWREVTTVYHEGVPGHHLQVGQTMLRADLLNRWQRVGCWVSGHGEGWGLYAERLMEELGYLDEPGARFGMLDAQGFRSARVIVDIGMHLELEIPKDNPFGWRPGERWNADLGFEFLRAHSRMETAFLKAELNRYLGWPGQAPSYKIGERIWLQARAEAEQRQGADFDLRAFHRDALNLGSLGLDPLRRALARV